MIWVTLALVAAAVLATRRIYEKSISLQYSNYTLGFLAQTATAIPLIAVATFAPWSRAVGYDTLQFWIPVFIIWLVLYPLQTYFTYRSLREGNLSDVTPIVAVFPALNALSSYLILGEQPSVYGLAGILCIMCGALVLVTRGKFRKIHFNWPVLYALISTASVAVGNTLDKMAILVSEPTFYAAVNVVGSAVVIGVIMLFFGGHRELQRTPPSLTRLFGFGVIISIGFIATMTAFSLAPTAYVVAVRSTAFLMTSIYGLIYLNEELATYKVIAIALFIVGIMALTV